MTLTDERLTRISKRLSYHLRHRPDELGLTLGPGGWVPVADLLAGLASQGLAITAAELAEVVARNSKQRFALDASGSQIRANQGHSAEVDLELEPMAPPALLYHGTGATAVAAIQREGLYKQRRHHVHLSADIPTARMVGTRHGSPRIFAVDAAAMHAAGHIFYRSANGVWLADTVPPAFLRLLDADVG